MGRASSQQAIHCPPRRGEAGQEIPSDPARAGLVRRHIDRAEHIQPRRWETLLLPQVDQRQGTARWISVYVARDSGAKALLARLYADKNGRTATLLASGSLSRPRGGSWNVFPINATAVKVGQSYSVALLAKGGTLVLRSGRDGSCASATSPSGRLEGVAGPTQAARSLQGCLVSTYVMGLQTVTATSASAPTGATTTQTGATTTPSATGHGAASLGPQLLTLPPINLGPPTITGTAQQGQTLDADPGSWLNGRHQRRRGLLRRNHRPPTMNKS